MLAYSFRNNPGNILNAEFAVVVEALFSRCKSRRSVTQTKTVAIYL